jgi:hypothetical protein
MWGMTVFGRTKLREIGPQRLAVTHLRLFEPPFLQADALAAEGFLIPCAARDMMNRQETGKYKAGDGAAIWVHSE